jgi:5-methylcytosine-specific restriction enzyme subunit McrC
MIKPLSQILSDGTLVDNTVHQAQEGTFRVGSYGVKLELEQGKGPWSVWPLMQRASFLKTDDAKLVLKRADPEYEHNTDDAFIDLRGFDPLNFTLRTGNLIGCVKSGDYTLRVSSRFGDEFLKYIIADADGFVELPDNGGTYQNRGFEWLLCYLWQIKLKKALRLGLPKTYETKRETLSVVRGRLDVVDFFINHERARYACSYREHSYDNAATRLIARTLEHLDGKSMLLDAHRLSHTFQVATAGRRHPLKTLLATQPVRNPYYADYNPVLTLAKRILSNDLTDFGDKDQTSAFFFDVSMLFEYFVRKLLKRAGVVFQHKNGRQWNIPSGLPDGRRCLIPDLVFELKGITYVFDVKYKSFDFRYGVKREDLFQLHTYIGQISNEHTVAGCGFIYPIRESRWNDDLESRQGVFNEAITQGDRRIPFHVAFLKIPEQKVVPDVDWPSVFRASFKLSAANFVNILMERLINQPTVTHSLRPPSTTITSCKTEL